MTRLLIKTLKEILISRNQLYKDTYRGLSSLQECVQSNHFVPEEESSQKILRVAVIGMPNAGKSTFINHLMDRKVCPASAKVHTTRTKAQAVFTDGNAQIIFLDTPGLVTDRVKKRLKLEKSFVKDGEVCLQQADTIGVIHDVSDTWQRERLDIKVVHLLQKFDKKPSFLVLNKVDVLKSKRKLLELTRLLTMNCLDGKPILKKSRGREIETSDNPGWPYFKEIFMVSALTGNGLPVVKDYLIKNAKSGKWIFPADVWSDQTPEKIIINTVKATLLDFLPQEIPYQMDPELELYEVNVDGSINAAVTIKCVSERVVKLVAGASSGRLRQIIESAQRDLQDVFQTFVKIRIVLVPPKEEPKN